MYNKKVLSEATKNLNSTKAPAKKKDRIVNNNKLLPFISNEGYKQGPPPAGTHYRIPSNTIYNPTDQNIIAVGSDGEKRFVAAGDTRNHRFGGSEYVDEFPMAAYGGDISIPDLNQYEDGGEYDLTDDEIEQLKKGGYIVEHLPSLPKKKGSKAYSRSLTATNKLFAQNPLLKKPKSKKNKIFDPQAKQFEKGGFQDDLGKHRQLLRDWTYGQSIGMLQKAQFGMNFKNRIKKVYNQEPTYSTNPQLAQFLNPEYQRVTEGPEVTVRPSSAQLLLNDANKRAEVANKNQKYTYTDPVSNQTIEYDSKQDFINKHKGNLLTGKTVINQGDELIPALGSALEFTGVPAGLRTLDRLKEDPLALAKNVGTTAYDLAALPQNLVYEGANYLFGDGKFNLPIDTEALSVTADAASLLPFVQGTSRAIKQGAKMIGTESGLLSNTLQTPTGFQNRVFDSNIQLGSFKGKGHLSEKGYNYRTLGDAEIKAIQESKGVFPKTGKAKGGNENVKYWTKGNEKNWYAENPNQQVIRIKDNKFSTDKVANANDIEIYNHETGAFESIIPKPATIKSGIGGIDMSKYEIKNPDYYTQLLGTFDSKALSPANKKFYKDLIGTVKKQNGLVTERQYNELQRLKTGNFNFGKKAYEDGGGIEMKLTPEEIQAYRDGGYIVDELD
jgi:hypothetical protein